MPRTIPTPIKTILAARDLLAGHEHADRAITRLLVDRLAADRGRRPPAWPALPVPVDPEAIDKARHHLDDLDTTAWDTNDVGTAYESLIGHDNAAWYTPPEAADAMVRLSIGLAVEKLIDDPDPGSVLRVVAYDPSCGAGVFLVAAARFVAAVYAERLLGAASEFAIAAVLPTVMAETVFGVDLDPVAVDISKAALWFELGCRRPITFMDRNVVCGNTLAGAEPPKLTERLAEDGMKGST
jgi:hypothetical protein